MMVWRGITALALCAAVVWTARATEVAEKADDPDDFQIAARPAIPEDPARLAEHLAKLECAGDWAQSPEAAQLARAAQQRLELFCRLVLVPGQPKSLSRATPEVRARACWVLGLAGDRRALDPLITAAVYDPDDHTRCAAAKSLARLREPVALRKLIDLAVARDWRRFPWNLRRSASIALRRYGDQAAIEHLLRELSYELAGGSPFDHKNKLRGSGTGLGSENPLGVQAPEIQLAETDAYPVLSALKEITGQSFGRADKDFRAWQRWWAANQPKFVFAD